MTENNRSTPDKREQRGVDTVGVVGRILQALLGHGKPARLKDLEVETGIPSAKLHRYLVSLAACGLVRRHEDGNRYDFGLLAFQIGQRAMQTDSLEAALGPLLQEFSDEIGESVGIARWVGGGVTITRWYEAPREIQITLRPGTAMSITSSSSGKLFGAFLPAELINPLVNAELAKDGPVTKARLKRVEEEFECIRARRMSQALGSRVPGINALSAPVFNAGGQIAACITVLGNAATFGADLNDPIGKELAELGERLSAHMGYVKQ